MTNKYTQLLEKERDLIFVKKQEGKSNTDIARLLGRDKSTIGRELKRNKHRKFNQYLPDTAQRKADKRKREGRKKNYLQKDGRLKEYILKKNYLQKDGRLLVPGIDSGQSKGGNQQLLQSGEHISIYLQLTRKESKLKSISPPRPQNKAQKERQKIPQRQDSQQGRHRIKTENSRE